MAKGYLPYSLDERLLLPADMREWLPEKHLALFILDVVSTLDLTDILRVYEAKDTRGRAGYHPAMIICMTHNLLKLFRSGAVFAGRSIAAAREQAGGTRPQPVAEVQPRPRIRAQGF